MALAAYTVSFFLLFLLAASPFEWRRAAPPSVADRFEEWIVANDRHYKDQAEKDTRFQIFQSNVDFIHAFNRNRSNSYRLGVNQFADLTLEEFKKMVNAGPPERPELPRNISMTRLEGVDAPESMDWRTTGGVTPAKHQGACGSCWAFAAVACVETLNHIKTRRLLSLSEQEVLDCREKRPGETVDGCQKGFPWYAFRYIKQNKGLALEEEYPYVARGTDRCDAWRVGYNAPITGFTFGPDNNEKALKELIAVRPAVVTMKVGFKQFPHYTGDTVLNPKDGCGGEDAWHSMDLIGYGVEKDGTKYWLVKNSWGKQWGTNGFGKIAREVPGAGPGGVCSIAASWVTVPIWD